MMAGAIDIPVVETDRLRLRAFEGRDLDAYAPMVADPETMRYVGAGKPLDRGDAWRNIALFLGHWALRGYGLWAVEERSSDTLVGRVGFLEPEGWPGCELAWMLGRPWWGRGYATEAALAAREFGRTELGIGALTSLILPDNHRSVALAGRLGARRGAPVQLMSMTVDVYEHPPFDEAAGP